MSSGWMRNCNISVWLRTEHESEKWACLPDNSIYVNYNLCEYLNTKTDIEYSAYTQCVSLWKADDET